MRKIAKLFEERQKINKKIEDIQNECPHFNISVKSVQERLDSSTIIIMYVCDKCLKNIGYPSKKDITNYLKQ
jgi:hypothetical protein|tara:strand:+ start:566 stop:781 length:216 start_codon:yes stop_codon:yes gene_type:complete